MCIYINIQTHIQIHTYTYTYTYIYMYTYIHTYIYLYTCIYTYTYTQTAIYTHCCDTIRGRTSARKLLKWGKVFVKKVTIPKIRNSFPYLEQTKLTH